MTAPKLNFKLTEYLNNVTEMTHRKVKIMLLDILYHTSNCQIAYE